MRCVAFAVALLVSSLALAAPVPKENDAARLLRIYGTPYEFTKPDQFELDGDKLRIFVGAVADGRGLAGAGRPFLTDDGPIGAPRVWREVKGDFTLSARVSITICPDQARDTNRVPIAGLIAWKESNNFIALSRMGVDHAYIKVLYTHGNNLRNSGTQTESDSAPLFLRLQRTGARVSSGYSFDGKKWTTFFPDEAEWGDTIKVGVYAKNLSDAPFEAAFDEYTLTVPKK